MKLSEKGQGLCEYALIFGLVTAFLTALGVSQSLIAEIINALACFLCGCS